MHKKSSIKVLTISLNAWNDTMPTGNTFSNLFGGLPSENISNLYCRNETIVNGICHDYFRVTEKDIFKNFFSKKKCGNYFQFKECTAPGITSGPSRGKQFLQKLFKAYRPTILLFLRELIWDTGVWKNEKLDSFIKKCNPDVIYMHGHCNLYMHRMLSYCKKISGARTAVFFGDDMYSYKSWLPFKRIYQALYRRQLRKTVSQAAVLFGGTKQLCDEYGAIFRREFHELYKSCSLPERAGKVGYNEPIQFVYAGNLLYGRDKALLKLKNAIDLSNSNHSLKCRLEIYSPTVICERECNLLSSTSSSFMGPRPYKEICEIMSKADIVLHVESWEKRQIRSTRLSFSTKIIDCMQSGSALFAIGPNCIASINQIKASGCAFYACSDEEISKTIEAIVSTPKIIAQYANSMHKYAEIHHDVKKVQDDFYDKLLLCIPE